MHALNPETRYAEIRAEAVAAAGPYRSLRQRARGYLDLYHASGGACVFALVAANGALWASWYLVCAQLAAMGFALTDLSSRLSPVRRYQHFAAYVDVLKEINHLVMVETYVLVHVIQEFGSEFAVTKGIPADLARDYAQAMAQDNSDPAMLRDIYHRHFKWEQDRVVSAKLDEAFAVFAWPFMRNLCQRPWVWFGYFKAGRSLNFRAFTDPAERIEKGLIAYDRAVQYGCARLARQTDIRLRIFPGFNAQATSLCQRPEQTLKASLDEIDQSDRMML